MCVCFCVCADAAEEEGDWRLRYSAVQAVACVCQGTESQGGLRNAAWLALQEQLSRETDPRVYTAMALSEVQERAQFIWGSGALQDMPLFTSTQFC